MIGAPQLQSFTPTPSANLDQQCSRMHLSNFRWLEGGCHELDVSYSRGLWPEKVLSCGVRYAVQVSIDVVVGICAICSRQLKLSTAYCAKRSDDPSTSLDIENSLDIEQMAHWRIVLKPLILRFLAQVNSIQFILIIFNTLMGLASRLCTFEGVQG